MRLFDDVKVGEEVFNAHGASWDVTEVYDDQFVACRRGSCHGTYFRKEDGGYSDFGQVLFHAPPILTVPPRPKKKVRHTITRWAQIIRSHRPDGFRVENISDFDESCQTDATWYPCTITFETEEP